MEEKWREGYIAPLFWQHGETEEVLRMEITKMKESGIRQFIVESRPHPDYLSYGWWRDLDIILDEAQKHSMKIWIFDDGAFPSGYGGGKIKKLYPEALKVYLRECHIDAVGPLKGSSFRIDAWMEAQEELVRIVAVKRKEYKEDFIDESLMDVTEYCHNGILYWDVPEGMWRVFVFLKTRNGKEKETNDYVNPIDELAVEKYIDVIYQEHYRRYRDQFGSLIQGFFVDEPRFGNVPTYDMELGKSTESFGICTDVIPYSNDLISILSAEVGEDFGKYLPYLWWGTSEKAQDMRYTYMNVVSRLFGENFIGKIGDWCRNHGVKAIGHIVEDNGAHARIGYGCGHFFRAMEGMDYSGLDVVYQVWPEYLEGRHKTPFGYLDSRFFYWGITKMASSLAAIDEKKEGITVCEIFGAYGWQEGLKLMKWLTDHVCARGVNFLIPHAFSPKEFPDEDCPPHFYARGQNPQWKYFPVWVEYAQNLCQIMADANPVVRTAVLYHAEAEWGGKYEPFEMSVQALTSHQIDCHVIPLDYLSEEKAEIVDQGIKINGIVYDTFVIPYGEVWPEKLYFWVKKMGEAGVSVYFMNDLPCRSYYKSSENTCWKELLQMDKIQIVEYENIAEKIWETGKWDVRAVNSTPYLICRYIRKKEKDIYFFINQSKYQCIQTKVMVQGEKQLVFYDPLKKQYYTMNAASKNGVTEFWLELTPYQSVFVMESEEVPEKLRVWENPKDVGKEIEGMWTITVGEGENARKYNREKLVNMAIPELCPNYSGEFRYEIDFIEESIEKCKKVYLDLGEVYESVEIVLNGECQGVCICPPYRVELTSIQEGKNELIIKVVNTLAKERGRNWLDRSMAQEPSGLLGPVRLISK